MQIESLHWFSDEVGADFAQVLERVVGLELTGPKFNDAKVIDLLRREPLRAYLHKLSLAGSSITTNGLRGIGRFPVLRELDLSGTRVGNRALTVVNNMPELEKIDVSGSRVGILGRLRARLVTSLSSCAARCR